MSATEFTGRFLESLSADDPRAADARAAILGVPYDGAVTYRGGASKGPEGLRRASESIENYCPKLDRSIDEFLYVDFGDLRCEVPAAGEVPGATPGERLVRSLRMQLDALPDLPLVAIGGDHLVAHPFLARAVERHPNLQIIHIDAHMDLRPDWDGEPFNHSTVLGRIVDQMGPQHRLHQWGIRSGERREYALARADDRIELLHQDRQPMLDRIAELMAMDLPIYVTIDVDGIDPADMPGTGTPEPDGLPFGWVEAALDLLATATTSGPGLIGADLVELAPDLDPTGRSQVAAARLIRTLLLALVRSHHETE
jgi:agmatinase